MDFRAVLAAVEDAPPVAVADVVAEHLAEALGASAVSLLIADLSGKELVRLSHMSAERGGGPEQQPADTVTLDGTPHGRALTRQDVQVERDGSGACVYAPVTNRGDAIGVLELQLPAPPDDDTTAEVARAAHLLALFVVANRRFTDLFEWGQRSTPLSLAAEIQRRLLPGSYTCEAGQATIAGWLQPAAEVAGDTFDYSLERDTLHLSMTDAMGHKVKASLLATTVVSALRNARRRGCPLDEQATRAGKALAECVEGTAFVTGQLVRIDLASGSAEIVNAGHPHPRRLRDGRVTSIELHADPPLGIVAGDGGYRVQPLSLEPGDRLFFLTDGVLERNAESLDVDALIAETADDHPRDAVQKLMHALLDATGGDLRDDATAMCVDWHGSGGSERDSSAGADR